MLIESLKWPKLWFVFSYFRSQYVSIKDKSIPNFILWSRISNYSDHKLFSYFIMTSIMYNSSFVWTISGYTIINLQTEFFIDSLNIISCSVWEHIPANKILRKITLALVISNKFNSSGIVIVKFYTSFILKSSSNEVNCFHFSSNSKDYKC